MTVKLQIEVTSPLTPDDRDLLAGLAVMTVAIANREINQGSVVQAEPDGEATQCGAFEFVNGEATGRVCVKEEPNHGGRHKYRGIRRGDPFAGGMVN